MRQRDVVGLYTVLTTSMPEEGSHHPPEELLSDPAAAFRNLYRDGGAQLVLGTPPVAFAEGRIARKSRPSVAAAIRRRRSGLVA